MNNHHITRNKEEAMTLQGSIALITGVSHDAGIGAAVCHELAYGATMGAVSAFTLSL